MGTWPNYHGITTCSLVAAGADRMCRVELLPATYDWHSIYVRRLNRLFCLVNGVLDRFWTQSLFFSPQGIKGSWHSFKSFTAISANFVSYYSYYTTKTG